MTAERPNCTNPSETSEYGRPRASETSDPPLGVGRSDALSDAEVGQRSGLRFFRSFKRCGAKRREIALAIERSGN